MKMNIQGNILKYCIKELLKFLLQRFRKQISNFENYVINSRNKLIIEATCSEYDEVPSYILYSKTTVLK